MDVVNVTDTSYKHTHCARKSICKGFKKDEITNKDVGAEQGSFRKGMGGVSHFY